MGATVKRGRLHVVAGIAAVLAVLLVVGASCAGPSAEGSAASTPTSGSSATTISSGPTAQELLDRAVAWIEAAPTQVIFGPDTVTYAPGAAVAALTRDPKDTGEFLVPWPNAWWSDGTDYYFQDSTGPPSHLTPEMAQAMSGEGYSEALTGVMALVTLRAFADPHRLLALSKATQATKNADGTWTLSAEVSELDLVALAGVLAGLSSEVASRYVDSSLILRSTLELGQEGDIRSMTVAFGDDADTLSYSWSRAEGMPELPGVWVELDDAMLQRALESGWRATVAKAAADLDFPAYSLGDSYLGVALRSIHVEEGSSLLLEYGLGTTGAAATTTSSQPRTATASGGFVLFEYSATNVPESEKGFVASKTLLENLEHDGRVFTVYTTAKGQPGRSILVRVGDTYVSLDRSGGGSGNATEELLEAVMGLQAVSPE
jgi:hypothetical protein